MTLDVYADLFDDDLEVVATALRESQRNLMWAEGEEVAADRA
ncbi:hypothetical protein BDB13_4604 [Rhodococcus sp. OK302]|nr:hypothetical protein BDB13_4604 [Rhodococcus sp. OK302]